MHQPLPDCHRKNISWFSVFKTNDANVAETETARHARKKYQLDNTAGVR